MPSISAKLFFLFILFCCPSISYAVIVANEVEVRITVEDGEMQQASITQVKFDGEEVDISKKNFMNRKVSKILKVVPGAYKIEWTTEKSETPWGGKKIIKNHQKVIVLEMSDAVVYINLKADTLATY